MEAGLLPQYRTQVEQAGIDFEVHRIPTPTNQVGNLGEYLAGLRKYASNGYDKMVFTDAWDVLFFGSENEVLDKIPDYGVLLGAERNCWPDEYLNPHFPDT